MSSLNHNFALSTTATILPAGLVVSGDFYDFKRYLKSIVNIDLANSSRVVTHYSIQINNTTATPNTTTTPVNVITLLSKGETSTEKRVEVEIIHSALPSPTLKDGNIEYAFTDGNTYCVKHVIVIKEIVNGATQTYNYSHHQDFRYYETPVTLSDFSFNDIQNGDTLKITGLNLVKADSYSPADSTYPEGTTIAGITNYPMRFTIQEVSSSDSCDSVDIYYELPYASNGSYDLENIQLTIGVAYKVSVEASWLLGYSTSRVPTKTLYILQIPEITAVDIEDLYLYDSNADVVTITIDPITSPQGNAVSKIWFEFYDSNDVLKARAGHATDGFPVTSTNNVSTSNEYSLKLSDITEGSLNNTDYYKVKAKVLYTNGEYRTSASFPTGDEYKNFTNTIPEIVGSTITPLYDINSGEKILDIVVKNEAYQLIAPNETDGIKFHFYDGATLVASTSPYTFVNSSGGANYSYPILLSEVTPVSGAGGAYLVNDKEYRIKAEVMFAGISSRYSVLSNVASPTDKVNFTKTIPEIVSNTINPLYTIDNPSNGKILDIEVKKQAYFLRAPNVTAGIKFHFYDGDTPVASTSSYPFVNSSGGANHSYPILLSEVTPVSGGAYLVNDEEYRIKAEVTFANNDTQLSALDTIDPLSDKVNFTLKYPVISTITGYDFQNDGNIGDSNSQVIATIVVPHQSYELVAPTSTATSTTGGIRFLIYDSDGSSLVASTIYYDFVNSGVNNAVTQYPIQLNEVNLESGEYHLSNGITYKVKAEVTIVKHSGGVPELRLSEDFDDLKGTQDVVPLTSVTISNSWALATDDNPSSSSTRFNNSPTIGISGYFTKTLQFNPAVYTTKNLDVTTTKFKIEYKVNTGGWQNVRKGVLSQKLVSESLAEAVGRVNAIAPVSVVDTNGKFDNVSSAPIPYDNEMIFFIPQQQVDGANAFTESDNVQFKITIDDSVNIWGSPSGSVSAPTSSNSLQLINKINTYDYVAGESSEPWNTQDSSGNLFLNIPVDWYSIHAHSVKVGVKYSSGGSYTYSLFNYVSLPPTQNVSVLVDPNQGTTLYYSVAYIVDNVNLEDTATTEGLTAEKSVENKFFPSSTDYTIATTSYKTFNTGGKSSITFDLAFNPASTSGIDGVNVYFTSPNSSQGSNIAKTRIGTYTASQGGNGKTIQLLYNPYAITPTINYASSSDNNTTLNVMQSDELIIADATKKWGDFDSASISFEAYRYSRVESTANYGTTYYVESGSSDFDKTIWNVPVLTRPSGIDNGSITLVGGVRNSSTPTKLSWPQLSVPNAGNLTYDFTMKKNVESSFIHNFVDGNSLTANEQTLTIDTNANAKYTITLKSVFAPSGAMREVSADTDTIEFHTIHVDVSGVNISVQNPSTTTKVNLSFSDAVVTGDSVTTSSYESSSFTTNIDEQHVVYSTTNPETLTRLAPAESNPLERIVSPASKKEYTLPVQTLATLYSFFMRLKAHINYKVNTTISQTPAVEISTQTTTTFNSKYIVSSIPIIGSSFTTTIDSVGSPVLSFDLNANGLEEEGFISVVVIIGQDGTPDKVEGESVILVFPNSGANSDYSNTLAGSGLASLDPRLAGGESYTSNPRSLIDAVMGTHSGVPSYTLTIGAIDSTGRYANSTLKMPPSSESGFTDGPINMWMLATTRRGTDFSALVATYSPPAIVSNLNITGSGDDFYVNFDLNNA
jgi:hypothetical protein